MSTELRTHRDAFATTARQRAVVPLLVAAGLVVLTQLYVSIPLRQSMAADLGHDGVAAALASGYALCTSLIVVAVLYLIAGGVVYSAIRRPDQGA